MQSGRMLAVANNGSDAVSFYDEKTKQKIKEITVGRKPHEVAFSPDNNYLLVSNYGDFIGWPNPGSTVSVINCETLVVERTIQLPTKCQPHGLHFLSNSEVLVTAQRIQALLKVNFLNGAIIQIPLGGGAHMVTTNAEKTIAYTGNFGSGKVSKIDLNTNTVVVEVKIGCSAESVALTPDEKLLFVTNGIGKTVTILDAGDLSHVSDISTDLYPARVAPFNHGKSMVVSNSGWGTAHTIDVATRSITRTFNTKSGFSLFATPITVRVLDDQSTAYFTNMGAGVVSLADLNTGGIIAEFDAASPDGLDVSTSMQAPSIVTPKQ